MPTPSLLSAVAIAPRDPILGVTEAYNQDPRPDKVNLGVGVYYDENGKVPLLDCVRQAEARLAQNPAVRSYLPIEGAAAYAQAAQELVFGRDSALLAAGRVAGFQTLGGTGALKVGADFLKRFFPGAQVWISGPSWENHRALFESAGFTVNDYPYFEGKTYGVDFAGMTAALDAAPAGDIVVLHTCCHNPTGADLSQEQWAQLRDIVSRRGLIPFLDMAYQGFGAGLEADALAVRLFAEAGMSMLVSSTFSKSFSLYSERIGALCIVASDAGEAARVTSQAKRVIRTNYSSPPTHGEKLVTLVLTDPELRALWDEELTHMRGRTQEMRRRLVQRLKDIAPQHDFSFVEKQSGLFSYTGIDVAQVMRLREEHGVYMVDTGRICVAALNMHNVDHVARAIAQVLA